jgi:hypothetical protein
LKDEMGRGRWGVYTQTHRMGVSKAYIVPAFYIYLIGYMGEQATGKKQILYFGTQH